MNKQINKLKEYIPLFSDLRIVYKPPPKTLIFFSTLTPRPHTHKQIKK